MKASTEPGADPVERQADAVDPVGTRPVERDAAFGVSVAVVVAGVLWIVLVLVYLAAR